MTENQYAELLHCQTAEQVRERVREWSSSLSDDEHLVRSTIIQIQLALEFQMKQLLFDHLTALLCPQVEVTQTEHWRKELAGVVDRMSFSMTYRVIKVVFNSHGMDELSCIGAINDLRNQVAHGRLNEARYKGRNPFKDHDALAQVYFEYWSATQQLNKIDDMRIAGPALAAKEHAHGCNKHLCCVGLAFVSPHLMADS
jgi:hypothetical protein